jgi:hypothetical protein
MVKKLFPLVLGLAGLALVIYAADWRVGLGIFLMLWADNVAKLSTD